jgi:hypothetical protein
LTLIKRGFALFEISALCVKRELALFQIPALCVKRELALFQIPALCANLVCGSIKDRHELLAASSLEVTEFLICLVYFSLNK